MKMRYVMSLALTLSISTSANASMFESVALVKWPWRDKEIALLLRTNKAMEIFSSNKYPDPFEESWNGSLHTLNYVEFNASRGAKYQTEKDNSNRREIKFTGWVFTAKRLSIVFDNKKLVSCQVVEVFGQSINLTMDVFEGPNKFPRTQSNCDHWIDRFDN